MVKSVLSKHACINFFRHGRFLLGFFLPYDLFIRISTIYKKIKCGKNIHLKFMKSNVQHIEHNSSNINVIYSDNEKSSYCLALSKELKQNLHFKHSNFNFFVQLKNAQ